MKNGWFEKFKETHNVIWTDKDFKQWRDMVAGEIDIFRKHIPLGARVLDCGCGFGGTAIPLSHYGFRVVCIDNDEKVLECAIENGERFGNEIIFELADISDIVENFGPDSFDACISGGVMEHFTEDDIIRLLGLQLKVAPIVIFSVPLGKENKTEVDEHGIYKNLWKKDRWLDFLSRFNQVEHRVLKSHRKVGGGKELFMVIGR